MNDERYSCAHSWRPYGRQGARQWQCGYPWTKPPKARRWKNRVLAGFNRNQHGKASDAVTSGIEGACITDLTKWDNGVILKLLFGYEWELTLSPAGARSSGRRSTSREEDKPVDATDPTM